MSYAIEMLNITKEFPGIKANDNVTLQVEQGEIHALLGENGAGKSTLIDMILGLTTPTSGTIQAFGSAPRQAIAASKIGAVLQTGGLLGNLTVWETVAMIATTFPNPQLPETVLRRTNLSHLARRRVTKCSGGEQQRLRFALALLPDPDFLILDEPTSGQDGKETKELLALLRQLNSEGITILLITHDMEIMASECSRAIIMGHRTVSFDGTPEELFSKSTDELHDLGLTKPPSVELSQAVPGLGYCKSMDELRTRLIAQLAE